MTLLNARPGYRRETIAGLPAVTDGREIVIVTHPLWRTDQPGPEITAATNDGQARGLAVNFMSVFEAMRRPL